ncbi:CRISPR-associated helicase Cas3' [Anaeromyxobacter oryzisoli]|uniref:CRISPR-associated helicase Cas3' n=1 Tax=Anaeromyxobacter oryzisoli TaxID=2925408 RepID=UPI001F5AD468|nr:CRISPR-associated helicase Cas3' [Anaeromyxobacter sp. SG63]
MSATGYFDYWAKARADGQTAPFHLLAFHSLDVAAVGAELLERDGRWLERLSAVSGLSASTLRQALPYLLALHDLGKFSEPFQDQQPEIVKVLQGARTPRACNLRHDTLGYLLWWSWGARQPDPREAGLLEALHSVMVAGEIICRRDLGEVMQSWMAAVLAHHGKPPELAVLPPDVFKAHPASPLARSRLDAASFARAVRDLLRPGAMATELDDIDALIERMKRSSWWLAGFTILCDWLGSDTRYFPYEREPRELEAYWATARSAARRAVDASGLSGSRPRSFAGLEQLFPAIAGRASPLQTSAATVDLGAGPQLFVLEDLTGSGKTEAALTLAHRLMAAGRADGLFFALPTMATANAMHARVEPLVGKLFDGSPSYLLTHSGPRLTERDRIALASGPRDVPYGREEQQTASRTASAWLADSRKKALLAELGVGTIDQALLATLQSKHAALRLLGLHRKVLVVDEVHACDPYMLGVLCALLAAHASLGGSAILLSATLPLEQRRKLTRAFVEGLGRRGQQVPSSLAYPLVTAFGADRILEQPVAPRAGTPRSLPVRRRGSVSEVVERLVEAARAGQCACWVRNSVKDAIEGHEAVAAALDAADVTLFHARFALGDRLRIEQDVLNRFGRESAVERRRGHVVVATQVVEQSLDIDFDVMVSDLCPIDRLIQRAGRLQRHPDRFPDRAPPVLEVLSPAWSDDPPSSWLASPFHRTARVYPDPAVLWRTARELHRREQLILPQDARELVERVYDDPETPRSLEQRSNAALGQDLAHASVASNAVIDLDLGYLREGADWSSEAHTPTRLGEPTTTVRLARVDERGARAWFSQCEARLVWPLSQLSVARRLVSGPDPGDEALRKDLEANQPFVGDDIATVLLRPSGDGTWGGRAFAERTRKGEKYQVRVRVRYSEQRGFEVQEGE